MTCTPISFHRDSNVEVGASFFNTIFALVFSVLGRTNILQICEPLLRKPRGFSLFFEYFGKLLSNKLISLVVSCGNKEANKKLPGS
jgi:hypothetical protein